MSDWTFSPEVIDKARGYLAQHAVVADDGVPGVFWVQGSAKRRYRVQTDAETGRASWINCTCPHGLNTGAGVARCSHAVAVLLAVREGLDLTGPVDSPRTFTITLADVRRCPVRSLLPSHYHDDGSCRCGGSTPRE